MSERRGTAVRVLGELVVIVMGVLIALWVEGYRQEREDRHQEGLLLEALQDEYAENRGRLDEKMGVYMRRRAAQLKLIELGRAAQGLPVDSATVLWAFALRGGTLDPADGVINSALGAGRLSLIRDAGLQQLIARWPSEVANFQDIDGAYADFFRNQLIPFLVDRIDMPPFSGELALQSGVRADSDYGAVLGTPGFNRRLMLAGRIHEVYEVASSDLYSLLDDTQARLAEVLGG